jgi:hypothetical protein
MKVFGIFILSFVCWAADITLNSILTTGRVDCEYIFKTYWAYEDRLGVYLVYFFIMVLIATAGTAVACRVAARLPNKSKSIMIICSIIFGVLFALAFQYVWHLIVTIT